MVADYTPDFPGTAELMRSTEMAATMLEVAAKAIPFARSISPDAPPYGVGYVSHFEVSLSEERISHARRAVAHLTNTVDYAVEVEIGKRGDISRADTGHHVLARTADYIEGH